MTTANKHPHKRGSRRTNARLAAAILASVCLGPLAWSAPAIAQAQADDTQVNPTATALNNSTNDDIAPLNVVRGRYVGERQPPQSPTPSTNSADAPAPSPSQTQAQAPAQQQPVTFEQKIAATLLKQLKESNSTLTKSETSAMSAFYAGQNPSLLWVNAQGLTQPARQVITELQNADTYALNPSAYKVPTLKTDAASTGSGSEISEQDLSKAELTISKSVLHYARHAKGGRVHVGQLGVQLTQPPKLLQPAKVLALFQATTDPAQTMRDMHPRHPQFVKLREKLLQLTGRSETSDSPAKIPNGPALKKGMTHDQVALLRARLKVPASGDNANIFDDALEAAVKAFQKKNGGTVDGIVGSGTRRALNGNFGTGIVKKIKLNMERWRWLPGNMDADTGLHVWVNIPGLRVRVVKKGEIAFSQKAIVGKVTHKTPVFSDLIEWVEIHPTWFVPNSIKVNDILPSLRRKTSTVMQRYNLKVNCGALGSNYKTIDWNKVDISKCSFSQPAGGKSVLGNFKFKFPNKHSVYLHDTHKRQLFDGTKRTYSHGCVRVKKPRRLAAILFENDNGMTSKQLDRVVDGPKRLRTEKLKLPVPIHITYFTALFDDEGNFKTLPDYYGHDPRLRAALSGRAAPPRQATAKKTAASKKPAKKKKTKQQAGWWQNLF